MAKSWEGTHVDSIAPSRSAVVHGGEAQGGPYSLTIRLHIPRHDLIKLSGKNFEKTANRVRVLRYTEIFEGARECEVKGVEVSRMCLDNGPRGPMPARIGLRKGILVTSFRGQRQCGL